MNNHLTRCFCGVVISATVAPYFTVPHLPSDHPEHTHQEAPSNPNLYMVLDGIVASVSAASTPVHNLFKRIG